MKKNQNLLSILLLYILMVASPTSAWAADDPNDDIVLLDGVSYHVLRNADDWARFRQLVADARGESDVNAIMEADFTVTDWVGLSMDAPFQGTFNGNGHTLNVEIVNPYNDFYMAPFVLTTNATIRNLHVTGSVSGGKHSAGLVGMVGKTETNCSLTVERVWVSVTVTGNDNSKNTGEILGGFIGHARKNSIVMSDCLFDGKIIYSNKKSDKDKYAGAFVGWGEKGASYDLRRLYENGNQENIDRYSICYYDFDPWGGSDHPCIYTRHNWGEVGDGKRNYTDQAGLMNNMNSNEPNSWQLVDGKAVPVITVNPTFECYDIVPGTDSGEEGMLKIPFSCDQVVEWIDAWYTDENGNRKDLPRLTLPKNSYSGFLQLPAAEAHRDLKMVVKLTPDYIIYTYDAKSDAVMHNPRNLKCEVLTYSKQSLTDAGAVRLQWEVKEPAYNDALDGDQFVVLRSLTGKLEDAASIGAVLIEDDVTNYEYKDSTLMSILTAKQIDLTTATAQVAYWVVRASAQQLWGLDAAKNPTVATVQPTLDKLTLVQPTGMKADWSDKEEYRAKVTWGYKDNDDSHRYVWDDRISMMFKVNTYNSANEPVDSTITAITAEQLRAGEAELLLNRSCVNYQITLLADATKTALGKDTMRIAVQVPDDKFYHENSGRIDKESLVARELQSSVLLTWANVDDEPVDYYEVYRRDVSGGNFELLVSQLAEMQFEDKTTSPVHQYEYKVRGVNSCEGLKYEETKTVASNCKQTGTVEGYLCFDDGTGIPGKDINITSASGQLYTTTTDESGFFRISDLPYVDGTETTYNAAPNLDRFSEVQPVTFKTTPGGNVVKDVTFTVKESVKFSGLVQYKGTSIPVQGVSFLVDGREVHNGSGKVVTDHDGKYSFRMLVGDHSIQAVKDGHVFSQDGFYHNGTDVSTTKYNFSGDMAGINFYDETRVKLIGRVAGGKDQAAIPLGNSLSRNNLGDDLQLVFALEGDNASRLVWDVQNTDKKERDEVNYHKAHDSKYKYQTKVHTTLNRMVVTPDVHTGEYEVLLPPVKWKIQQITAKGYATLFQSGQVGDVIDLTDSLTLHTDHFEGSWLNAEKAPVESVDVEYHAQYNRIYHSPVVIDYKQIGYEDFDFFGDQYYSYKDVSGNKQKLTLAYGVKKKNWPKNKRDSLETHYTFGYPVFSIERKYPVKISATERYYYNNNIKSDTIDVIRLSGGEVTIHNGMESSTHRDVVMLDSVGEATYNLVAAQVPYLLTGSDALRTVTMTLLLDGTHYEAQPLRAYLLNIQQLKGAKDILNYSTPLLVDVLRDPPGGSSKATLSKGSTLKYSYQMDMTWNLGMNIGITIGGQMATFTGVVAAPMGAGGVGGFNFSSKNDLSYSIDLMFSGSGNRAFNYTMTATEDISTSSEATMVGADADLYIGIDQNIVVKPATAIRAIPDSVFRQMGGLQKSGRMVEIAQGTDSEGKLLHLVRDEVVTYGPVINSNFVHSQHYIVNQLIPSLVEQCQSLMFTGSKEQAKEHANATGELVYWSKVDKEDKTFGAEYEIIEPDGYTGNKIDEVAHYQDNIVKWMEMIAQNEREKLTARDLVQNFDVDGGSTINYGETFTSDYSSTNSFVNPMTPITEAYFDSEVGSGLAGLAGVVGPVVAKMLSQILTKTFDEDEGSKEGRGTTVEVKAPGFGSKIDLIPAVSFNVKPRDTESTAFSRKESFTISMDRKSHLNFDVYRVETGTDGVTCDDPLDVFIGNNFAEQAADNYDYLKRDLSLKNYRQPRSFVYRTRGGATCRPYEDERKSVYYNPGTVIDERTKKIENPIIKMDKQSLSGVPFGDAARFKLYLTNESEAPEAAYSYFKIYQSEKSNPDGAKMLVDGMPLTGDGRTIEVRPGEITEKTLEVYASEKFDYQGLNIGLISVGDMMVFQEVSFDVHYLQTAGPVAITTPGDKWIMNCDAPQEDGKGWYMPVIISGFDKNQHNFDHIEFQYKESTRGDDYWTNLCGYYADSTLYAAASGTKEMIPENGNITTRFFGEGDVMEKAYDLRAVLFCRNGNAFLTHESKVLSGVKDTRRPQLFGTPDPMDGVLEAGENIIFNFSEDIEYNYLREATNFEVKGETNETSLQEAPSLQFTGKGYAQSEARRNFADKSITVEVMVKPADTGKEMPIFSHGRDGKELQLWLTADRRLRAVVDDKVLEGTTVLSAASFQRVALVLDNDQKKLTIYAKKEEGSLGNVTYNGYGPLIFGSTNQTDATKRSFFTGHMLQGRIWNRTMDINQLNSYGNKLLTGYEMGLMDYYPMNEGKGDYATDHAQGAHLKLNGAEWAQPDGMSLQLDMNEQKEIKGLKLNEKCFQRTAEQDYTLMFWFRTNDSGHGTLLCNGSGKKTDVGAINKFFIGFEGPTLKYRSYGQEFVLGDKYSDDRWHHYVMTVNRSHHVATIYIDQDIRAQFATDSLGGMTGDFYLGNMVWKDKGSKDDKIHQENPLTGHIDGLALFEQALPATLIKRYSEKALGGSELGLLTYIDFERQVRQQNNEIVTQPYALNKKVQYDKDGNVVDGDSVFANPVTDILQLIDTEMGAPIQAYEELHNLNFSFVGRDNRILVNIDELEKRINKRTVYATVRDIPDLNGNFMASPATVSMFVDLNPLRWAKKSLTKTVYSSSATDSNFGMNIMNNSGAAHTYQVENLPRWLSVDKSTDIIDARSEHTLTFTINKNANVGTYDDVIYLVDENGLAEPLALNIIIEGRKPGWSVSNGMKRYSMSIVGRIDIAGDIVTDKRDIVGAFDAQGNCMGVCSIYDDSEGESLIYMSVYDSLAVIKPLNFRLWHYESGKEMLLTTHETVTFTPESVVGSTKDPLLLHATDLYVQHTTLKTGWNWVSLNVLNDSYRNVKQLLDSFIWHEGDMLTDENNNISLLYHNEEWLSNTGLPLDRMMAKVSDSYRVRVVSPVKVQLTGSILKTESDRTITVKQGWNSIGYTPIINLPIATALSDYFDEAEEGDIVKSQTAFAVFSTDANGSGKWKGDLEYLKPGEGYMLYRKRAGEAKFVYPFYDANETFFEETSNTATTYSSNMTLTAIAKGVKLQGGDKVIAYADAEIVGESIIKEDRMYMTINGDSNAPLSFVVERDGNVIASSYKAMNYVADAISGSYNMPTTIDFTTTDEETMSEGSWYSLQGIKLEKKPTQKGIYIYNGSKQVIK